MSSQPVASSIPRSHDGGPRPAEDGVGAGAGRAGQLRDEPEGHGGGDGQSRRVSVRPERRFLQHAVGEVSGQRGEQRQDGAGQWRRPERSVWNQEGRHAHIRVGDPERRKLTSHLFL